MKIYYLLLITFVVLISISCVSANDNTNITIDDGGDVSNINTPVTGNFKDLSNDITNIHSGETYNLTKNYTFDNGNKYLPCSKVIQIKQDNIVINGNGFTIDAGSACQRFALFDVLGNNVTIKNLFINNSQPDALRGPAIFDGNTSYSKTISPINWEGNNGHLYNCTFSNNVAVIGGALNWRGNNGSIDRCLFINNTATAIGGGLCIGGENNIISNCVFINCTSKLSGEAIYVDRNRKMINFTEDSFTNEHPIIDGAAVNIGADIFYYSRMAYAGGDISGNGYKINLIPLVYSSIVNGGVTNYNDKLKYSALFDNRTGTFVLNFVEYNKLVNKHSFTYYGMDYLKTFCFSNITNFNQVFDSLIRGNYSICVTQNLIANLVYEGDYNLLTKLEAAGYWFNTDKDSKNLINKLTVKFHGAFTINSGATWDLSKMKYNTIYIMGHGSTINGKAGDRDEKKWVLVNTNSQFYAENMTVKKFNTALTCTKGISYLKNIDFRENRMDYLVCRDWGAAILNTAVVICDNCAFEKNYAKNGGAIFNQGVLSLTHNTTFSDNKAYGKGNDICVGDGGKVQIDGKNITSDTDHVLFAKSVSQSNANWAKIVAIGGSAAIGFIAGVITANPVAGIAVGAAVGAGFGAFTSAEIAANTYDVNYDRVTNSIALITECVVAGAAGGLAGYFASGTSAPIKAIESSISRSSSASSFENGICHVGDGYIMIFD